MKKIVFTEEFCQPENLFPFTLTRQIQDIRIGILTIRQKWELYLGLESFDRNEGDYKDLDRAFTIDDSIGKDLVYMVHGNILPTPKLIKAVGKLKHSEFISVPGKEGIVYCISKQEIPDPNMIRVKKAIEMDEDFRELKYPWDIFHLNDWAIRNDFDLLTKNKKGQKVSATNRLINPANVFIEKGAQVEHCFLNASEGP